MGLRKGGVLVTQAARCLAELGVPHYHHEFVKRALLAGFETPRAAPALLSLLAHLGDSNQITQVGCAVLILIVAS